MKLVKTGKRRALVAFVISRNIFFWFTLLLLLLFSCSLLFSPSSSFFSSFSLATLPLPPRHHHDDSLHHQLMATWPYPVMEAISEDSSATSSSTTQPKVAIAHAVLFPDHISIFLKCPPSVQLFTPDDIDCVYLLNSSTVRLRPLYIDAENPEEQIVRCPPQPRGFSATLGLKEKRVGGPGGGGNHDHHLHTIPPPGPTYRWDWLAYEAMIDEDNTTIVFVKGFNLRPGRLSDPTRFQCVFGWDLSGLNNTTRFFLRSEVLSIGQEVARCKTPLAVLSGPRRLRDPIKVSIRLTGRATLPSIAMPILRPNLSPVSKDKKHKQPLHEMCVCTMLRNQGRFLREWIMYHSRIGVQSWFIYDNNSDDNTDEVIRSLNHRKYNITKYIWPWIKSQEAGFAHCALRTRGHCKWVGFIDVDEFFHFPSTRLSLHDVFRNYSKKGNVGEIRTFCYNFGPSGLKQTPTKGVTVGYTCRMAVHERHKSIVRPEALSPSLVNVVHHFYLKDGFKSVTLDRPVMVINHYKYQVWQVFKDKFYRRVATYVSDWKDEANVGSKDRAPGLGTQPVEPPDWPAWFCEVNDTKLRDVVFEFADPDTRVLPWGEE